MASSSGHVFGRWKLAHEEVFAESPLCLAFVNLKPVVPGHVLVIPRRLVKRLKDLTQAELGEAWKLARCVGSALEAHVGASAITFAIQDGEAAGQTVEHVHMCAQLQKTCINLSLPRRNFG